MTLPVNEGDRPSRLELARYATAELDDEARAAVEAWLADHPEGRQWLESLERARDQVAPFDADAIRARAARAEPDAAPAIPSPANRPSLAQWLTPLIAVAAVALFALLPGRVGTDRVDGPDIVFRGGATLQVHHLVGDRLQPYRGEPVGQGDVLGFKLEPGGHSGVVVLSVDGAGAVTVLYPDHGTAPERLVRDTGLIALPGSVILDAAPGPEVFVAVFDEQVGSARHEVEHAWQAGGADAVQEWAAAHPAADAVLVERR